MQQVHIDIEDLIIKYNECPNLHKLAQYYHTSHMRLSQMLKDANISIHNVGKKRVLSNEELDAAINDYVNGMSMEEVSKKYQIRLKKIRQLFKEKGVKIGKWRNHTKTSTPPHMPKQKIVDEQPTKQCPYCNWKTKDVDNKSHAYTKHLWYIHHIDITKHLIEHPEDNVYEKDLLKYQNCIKCEVCGKYVKLIDNRHLATHGMTKQDYILQYPNAPLISESTKIKLQHCLSLMYENQEWERYSSSYEEIIINFLHEQNVEIIEHDRRILKPLELDVYLPQQRVGIEINGNKWHTEWFGQKRPNYHLEKTKLCNEQNINLIHIFEDEIILKKEIVLNKIQHIIGCQMNLPKIMGRKCEIEEIDKEIAEYFLNDYHIQGYCPSTKHLGAIWEGRLIAVMSFKEEKKNSSEWELTRFASDFHFICQGVGGKLFQRFIKMFNPLKIKSFADRRWTLTPHDNLYIKLGFQLDGFVKPDYKYFNPSVDKVRRFHKFNFRKHILSKKYGLDPNLTETEMVKMLGYDRIWDCGLIRYVWKKKEV